MEILCKLYLELANVVPSDCTSSREVKLRKVVDRYGIALMMIANGCADPKRVAAEAIEAARPKATPTPAQE